MAGIVAYMAPEQAQRRHDLVGPRSDIFSLGAILYEILTGRPPFASGTLDEIISQARECTFDPPRQRNRTVPKALEAICLKAMARDQADRYETAVALGDDLGRWLADEPVLALPERWYDRLARKVRLHRVAASVGFIGLLVVALVATGRPSGSATPHRRASGRDGAEARLDLAVESVRKFREIVSTNLVVRNRPNLAGLRKKLLGEPLKFFEQLRADLQKGGDTSYSTTFKLAKANLELAGLLGEIDSKPNAVREYQEAIALLVPACDIPIGGRQSRYPRRGTLLVASLGQLGLVQRDLGRVDEARASLRRSAGHLLPASSGNFLAAGHRHPRPLRSTDSQ